MKTTGNPAQLFRSIDEIETLVRRFETCTLGAGEFRHREHLTVILWYLTRFPPSEATARMREGLYRFLDYHVGDRGKYHETITIFWVKKVQALLGQAEERGAPLAELANEVIGNCGDAALVFDYYSRELIDSATARSEWVEPDLQPLDF